MANVNTSTSNFAEAVKHMLDNYMVKDVVPSMERAIKEVGKEGAKRLKANSPVGATGKYAKGWSFKIEDSGRLLVGGTIYGKSGTYQLAHLLAKPHLMRNGQMSTPNHDIQSVEAWTIAETFDRFYRYMGDAK